MYFLGAREGSLIDYPFRSSRLLYIGMSKSRQNSIGSRLRTHLSGRSGNIAIFNYSRVRPLVFSYFGIEVLRALGTANVPQIESFFLDSFLSNHGAYPICNNQCGVEFAASVLNASGTEVDWARWE